MSDRVEAVTGEVLAAIRQVRGTTEADEPSPEILHSRMRGFVERAMRRAGELGFPPADVQDIGYALVALVDEAMLNKSQAIRDYFLPRMLQLELFNENVAGEGVFTRLEALYDAPGRADVLRVYYIVLMFGFQGRYRVRGGEVGLAAVTERAAEALARAGVTGEIPLSPRGARPSDAAATARRNLPLAWFAIFCLVSALGFYAYHWVTVSERAEELSAGLERADTSGRGR